MVYNDPYDMFVHIYVVHTLTYDYTEVGRCDRYQCNITDYIYVYRKTVSRKIQINSIINEYKN